HRHGRDPAGRRSHERRARLPGARPSLLMVPATGAHLQRSAMTQRVSRREFVASGTAGIVAAGAASAFGQAPAVITSVKPVVMAVMDTTDHHLIVGKGAQDFARHMGFAVEADLNTPNSRAKWLEWKRRIDPEHYLDPTTRDEASRKVTRQMMDEGLIDPGH